MNTNEIIQKNSLFKSRQLDLYKKSPYFPEFILEHLGNEFFISSLVRIKRHKYWFKIHVLECMFETGDIKNLLYRFNDTAYKVIYLHTITDLDSMDELQIEEKDRLLNGIPLIKDKSTQVPDTTKISHLEQRVEYIEKRLDIDPK